MLARFVERQICTLRWLVVVASLAASVGCYEYVPTAFEAVPSGDRVRALLTAQAQEDVLRRTGTHYRILEGKVLDRTDDQMLLSVPTVKVESEYGSQSLYQRIDVTRDGVVRVDVKEMDKFKTFGLVGLTAVAATFIVQRAIAEGEPGTPGGSGLPGSDNIRGGLLYLTLFRW
jgi:hypothetical protein